MSSAAFLSGRLFVRTPFQFILFVYLDGLHLDGLHLDGLHLDGLQFAFCRPGGAYYVSRRSSITQLPGVQQL